MEKTKTQMRICSLDKDNMFIPIQSNQLFTKSQIHHVSQVAHLGVSARHDGSRAVDGVEHQIRLQRDRIFDLEQRGVRQYDGVLPDPNPVAPAAHPEPARKQAPELSRVVVRKRLGVAPRTEDVPEKQAVARREAGRDPLDRERHCETRKKKTSRVCPEAPVLKRFLPSRENAS